MLEDRRMKQYPLKARSEFYPNSPILRQVRQCKDVVQTISYTEGLHKHVPWHTCRKSIPQEKDILGETGRLEIEAKEDTTLDKDKQFSFPAAW